MSALPRLVWSLVLLAASVLAIGVLTVLNPWKPEGVDYGR
jgi:hypothetical protein